MANFLMRSILGRTALIAATTIGLSACVAKDTSSSTSVVSSSSSEVSSSIGMVSSSSSAIASSVASISSSSSVAVASSSASVAPSSSSIASSSSSVASNCSDAAFCDDFESGSIGGAPNTVWKVSAAGSLAITNEKAYSGTKSIKVKSLGQKYNRNFMTLDLANIGNTKEQLYGRMMVWADDPGNAGGDFTFVQAEGAPKSGQTPQPPAGTNVMYRYRVDSHTTNGNLMANYDTWLDANNDNTNEWNTDCGSKSNSQLPRGKWSCVEWHFDAVANELRYWLNGNELSEMGIRGGGGLCLSNTQKGNWTAPAKFERLNLGVEQYDNGVPARTLYIDDVKLDSKYVGCPDMPVVNSSSSQTVASSSKSAASSSSMGSTSSTSNNSASVIEKIDFESVATDAVPAGWGNFISYNANFTNSRSNNNFALTDSTRAHSGTKSLYVKSDGAPTEIVKALPKNLTRLYTRMWVYMDRAVGNTPGDNHEHFTGLKAAASPFDANKEIRIGSGKGHLGFNIVPDGDAISPRYGEWNSGPSTPVKKWYCVEVGYHTDTAYDETLFWLDGQLVNSVKSSADWHAPVGANYLSDKMDYIFFGWHSFSGNAVNMWIDDIVIAKDRIGCN